MQTLRKKTSPLKYRNEPARFFGDGVVFKAKLIGILEVGEARGDRMCQEALQDLKIAIRAAGEHKQRITIHVTIEGLRLRDEKNGESLYHHPVHKISFIAQDMTDSRAFGYIFGSPDCGHRFFGIKTDKAASQVVLAMRDLFQCVFELKKKEIELAKQHIQNRITAHEHQQIKSSILEQKKTTSLLSDSRSKAEKSPETTANLVDLEQELSSIQRGITQMERITPNDDPPTKSVLDDDPFGDSFAIGGFSSSATPFNILPPPTSSKRGNQLSSSSKTSADDDVSGDLSSIIRKSDTPPLISSTTSLNQAQSNIDSWFNSNTSDFNSIGASTKFDENFNSQKSFDDSNNLNNTTKSELIEQFTDLDPLGTGKLKPYVDKKYFFHDLKNPPKKVLKDLSEPERIFDAHFSPQKSTRHISNNSNRSQSAGVEKVIDPFDEEDFSKINIDQLEPSSSSSNTNLTTKPPISPNQKSIILPDTKISTNPSEKSKKEDSKFSYELPPPPSSSDNWSSSSDFKRQNSDSNSSKNVFSVSKKLPKPNLFGQRNVKRDSNGINMRRLQESDSLSENEPELPPRLPDSNDPPPLPPKNQSSDYNRFSSSSSRPQSSSRYDYANKFKYSSDSPPSIPLPSRKINRTESSSSTRSMKKSMEDDEDYLSPMPECTFPTLPPPPLQKKDPTKTRMPRKSDTDPRNLDAPTPKFDRSREIAPLLPDITLSQLLTLGIDDLAHKLNVPAVKLNTMTLVELTTYLNDFIEKSKHNQMIPETPNDSPVFKVNFEDAVFEAKFDDNFGNELSNVVRSKEESSFIANFDNFNQTPISVIPTADRYAVFREIIDQEIHHQESVESNNSNSLEEVQEETNSFDFSRGFDTQFESPLDAQFKQSPLTVNQASNKITEALSGVKDRYQALRELRNIVLVEDLFDKTALPPPLASISDSNLSDEIIDDNSSGNQQIFETTEVADNNSLDNIPTYSISWVDAAEEHESIINDSSEVINQTPMQETIDEIQQEEEKVSTIGYKDDLEIDDYLKKAISELSLDQRLSPNTQMAKVSSKDDLAHVIPAEISKDRLSTPKLNDMSTSPISIKSPSLIDTPLEKEENSSIEKELCVETDQLGTDDSNREKTLTPGGIKTIDQNISWANFEANGEIVKQQEIKMEQPSVISSSKQEQESAGSSDGKLEWKQREKEYRKRWPKHHTSSSSRDVSPWEDGGSGGMPADQKKRSSHVHTSHYDHRYARPPAGNARRRRNSCDEDYEDDDYEKRPPMPSRMRASKGSIHRSKELLDSESPSWYHGEHWYPDNEENDERIDRHRSHFDRNAYERSTYGPPYLDKREPKSFPYDRRVYDKRSKYYRYNRPDYEYDPYEMPPPPRAVKGTRIEYEAGTFERGSRESRSAREYFYDRDRRSFDSNESYDSGRMNRMGSGEIYHHEYRDRYRARRNQRSRMDDDSDEEVPPKRPSAAETGGSLQRGQAQRTRAQGNIKLDEDIWGSAGKWKQRPSSATAERREADLMSGSGGNLSDSEGDKEKRQRKKTRQQSRGKEVELRSNYATIRHPMQSRRDYYDYEDEPNEGYDEPPSNASPRANENYHRKRGGGLSGRTGTTPKLENKSFSEYFKPGYDEYENRLQMQQKNQQHFKKSTSRDLYIENQERKPPKRLSPSNEPQPLQQPVSGKFNFDGFESDFNNVSQQQLQDKQNEGETQKFGFEREFSTSPNPSSTSNKNGSNQQKLRFNENVSVSKFDKNSSAQQMFEDDFIESWTPEGVASLSSGTATSNMQSSLKKTITSNLKISRQENIKKSDSVNIFARKNDEDPFANDDFFNSEENGEERNAEDPFGWDNSKNNFANFDDSKNI